jgi:ribosomal protein L21E
MQDRSLMNELIRQHLNRAMVRMERQADKSRLERSFEVGDLVFLKLQPYIQSSLAPHSNQKLAFKFFTSFQVVQKVGQVAYKLDLPPSLAVHPVFHVSQLKKAIGANV